jgi:hypothetical protein
MQKVQNLSQPFITLTKALTSTGASGVNPGNW